MAGKAAQADVFRVARFIEGRDLYPAGIRQRAALRFCSMIEAAGYKLYVMSLRCKETRKIEKAVVVTAGEITAEM